MRLAPSRLFSLVFALNVLAHAESGSAGKEGYLPHASMTWIVQEQVADPAPVTIKAGHAFARTRVLPPALFLLDGPAVLPEGTPLLEANTELGALSGVDGTGCTLSVPPVAKTMKPAKAIYSRSNRFLCLHDADADGQFDSYVWLYSATVSRLVGRWDFVPLEGRIAPVPYHSVDPAKSQASPWLYLVLINNAEWVGKLRLGGVLTSGEYGRQRIPYTSYIADPEKDISIKTLPMQFQAFRGTFEVSGKTASGLIFRTIKPIPSAPFSAGW